MTYADWVSKHCRCFGMDKQSDLEMVTEWANVFALDGFTPDELDATTTAMIRNPPRFRNEHLERIHTIVRANRVLSRQVAQASDTQSVCDYCGNSGFVTVPHPEYVRDYRWMPPFPTAAVICPCYAGRQQGLIVDDYAEGRGEKQKRKRELPKMLRLEQYAQRVPNWLELIRDHQNAQIGMANAKHRATWLDKTIGQILSKVGAE